MLHIDVYSFDGVSRLARDASISKSTVSRLLHGETSPTFYLTWTVVERLSSRLGKHLDPMEVFSITGTFPTRSVCRLCGCPGCSPDFAELGRFIFDGHEPIRAGQWSLVARTRP